MEDADGEDGDTETRDQGDREARGKQFLEIQHSARRIAAKYRRQYKPRCHVRRNGPVPGPGPGRCESPAVRRPTVRDTRCRIEFRRRVASAFGRSTECFVGEYRPVVVDPA